MGESKSKKEKRAKGTSTNRPAMEATTRKNKERKKMKFERQASKTEEKWKRRAQRLQEKLKELGVVWFMSDKISLKNHVKYMERRLKMERSGKPTRAKAEVVEGS